MSDTSLSYVRTRGWAAAAVSITNQEEIFAITRVVEVLYSVYFMFLSHMPDYYGIQEINRCWSGWEGSESEEEEG